jgi:outer membrane lipoprotein
MRKEFLDPATLPPGTFIIVTGEVAGTITLPLDEIDYVYSVLEIRELKVSPQAEEAPNIRMRPKSPYWGPYWRPYPYW